ncbi:MAG: hypothetical protein IT162_04560 [Bryobacterales bacterium]|nr:hypothetical protein [Bryobacterales bacterium]
MTVIEQGHIGLLIANDGDAMPVDRVLAQVVDCDHFQDAKKFLRVGGQKGRQSSVLTAGLYRINTALFKIIRDVPITKIDSDKIGIVTVMDGAPMPTGQMAAKAIAGHENNTSRYPKTFEWQRFCAGPRAPSAATCVSRTAI